MSVFAYLVIMVFKIYFNNIFCKTKIVSQLKVNVLFKMKIY